MNIKLATALFGIALSVALPASAATYTIQPGEGDSKDTFSYEFLAGAGEFGSFVAVLGASNTGPDSPHSAQTFIQFDLSSLAGVDPLSVTSATLTLHVIPSSLGGTPSDEYPVDVSVRAVTAPTDWNETGMSWATKPAFGSALDVIEVDGVNEDVTFDVTDLVKSWLDGSLANRGMAVIADEEVRDANGNAVGAWFASSSGPTASQWPALTVTAVPEPASVALLVLGGSLLLRRRAC